MIVCGLKLTHDGAVAVLDGNRLLFSHEMEKRENRQRHSPISDLMEVEEVLQQEGLDIADIDLYCVDGWHGDGGHAALLHLSAHRAPLTLPVAPYHEMPGQRQLLEPSDLASPGEGGLPLGGKVIQYASTTHAAGHLMSALASAPADFRERAVVGLVWDGGMLPLCYLVSQAGAVESLGPVTALYGNTFAEFCGQLPPYEATYRRERALHDRTRPSSIAGKAMAYAGLGAVHNGLLAALPRLLDEQPDQGLSIEAGRQLGQAVRRQQRELAPEATDADLVATVQEYLGVELLRGLQRLVRRRPELAAAHLVMAGGCALNIKWNSRIRAEGPFRGIWIPPFPNDAGSAIGAAVGLQHILNGRTPELRWDPYSGPSLLPDVPDAATWSSKPHSADELAALLADGEPVVVLRDRAEVGPRALGHRSILADPRSPEMQRLLNRLKGRESYRPVAPLCLEADAPKYFDPGSPDPYMLYDHRVRDSARDLIPAVVHTDGTARLQTVNRDEDAFSAELLEAFRARTGLGVLCNTSANDQGRGFFPSARHAADWGRVRHVYANGMLHSRRG